MEKTRRRGLFVFWAKGQGLKQTGHERTGQQRDTPHQRNRSRHQQRKDASMKGHGKEKRERVICIWGKGQGHKQTGNKRTGQQRGMYHQTDRDQKDRETKRYISPEEQISTTTTTTKRTVAWKDKDTDRQGAKGQGNKEIFLTKEQTSKEKKKEKKGRWHGRTWGEGQEGEGYLYLGEETGTQTDGAQKDRATMRHLSTKE